MGIAGKLQKAGVIFNQHAPDLIFFDFISNPAEIEFGT
jgi:hypothetical protein